MTADVVRDMNALAEAVDAKVGSKTAVDNAATKTELQAVDGKVNTHMADYVKHPGIALTSGTGTAYTVTLDPGPVSIPEFFGITIIPHATNGANPTLNINGKGAIALKDQKGVAYAVGKLLAGKPYMFRKVGSDFLADSGSGGGGNLQPNQALAGFTFTNDNGEQVGLGDADLIPGNIKKDVNVFGVIGTLIPIGFTVGDVPLISADAPRPSTTDTTITKVKEIKWTGPPMTLRISYDGSGQSGTGHSRIYINGVARGIDRTLPTTNTTLKEDLLINTNDLIQLYVWNTTYASRTNIDKFRVCVNPDVGTVQLD